MATPDEKIYQLALSMTPGLGCKACRQLLDLGKNATELFGMTKSQLIEFTGGTKHKFIDNIVNRVSMPQSENEMRWMERYGIQMLYYTDQNYPQRLNRTECIDTPIVLFMQGQCDLNNTKTMAMVGSRRATEYGKEQTTRIVNSMQGDNILVISGLAYGIDGWAHRSALDNQLPTVAVLGHGLDNIYPSQHRKLASDIINHGGALVTEYPSGTKINPVYFPARNRIVAAMSDVVIVVEAADKGGALITANIACGYNRDVMAVPGRLDDTYSVGCNNLIASHKASILRSADDIYDMMNWTSLQRKPDGGKQQELFKSLGPNEQSVYNILKTYGPQTIDEMTTHTTLSLTKIADALLNLELDGNIKCLPGKLYKAM
ncbi:MAG: DNA-processing protein DprA [Bacteroidales bacterium]|nr:DNA-processing protein DprA [Candidatus Colimorpha onthohippi]